MKGRYASQEELYLKKKNIGFNPHSREIFWLAWCVKTREKKALINASKEKNDVKYVIIINL